MAKSKIGIKPLGRTVLVQFKKMKETSESGIILPESVNNDVEQKEAIVIALGSGNLSDGKKHKFEVSVGDTVIIPAHAGDRIEKNNELYVVVDESRITAIVE
jgi:co-chaperonin GroES (HSP10)